MSISIPYYKLVDTVIDSLKFQVILAFLNFSPVLSLSIIDILTDSTG